MRHACIFLLARAIEILHSDGPRQVRFQCLIDVLSGEFFKGGSGGIKIPIVVAKEGAGELRAANGPHIFGIVFADGMVNAGSRHEQVSQLGRFLDG